MRACEQEAARRHIERLYLCTDTAAELYQSLGWTREGDGLYENEALEIYERDIRGAYPAFFG